MRNTWLKSVSFTSQHWTLLALTGIVVMALLLRVVPFQLMWWGDSGRDVLIARMIVEHGEVATTGPMAAGGHGLLKNSPVYYYFLAGLWWLTRSPVGMSLIFAALGTACVVVNYFSGKELGTRLTGLLAAAFTAFSYLMIFSSRAIFQPYAALIFLAIMYLGCLKTMRRPTTGWLAITTLCLFVALHLHYSTLIITPFVVGLLLINWFRSWPTTPVSSRLVWPILLLVLVVTWYGLTHSLTTTAESTNLSTYLLQRAVFFLLPDPSTQQWEWTNPFNFVSYLFEDVTGWTQTLLGGFLLSAGWFIVAWGHIRDRLNTRFLMVMTLLSTVLLTASLTGDIYSTYFSAYYFLVFLALAYLITIINQKSRILAAMLACLILVGLYSHHHRLWWWGDPSEFEFARYAVTAVLNDYQQLAPFQDGPPALLVSEKTPDMPIFDWGNPSFWYFLEVETNYQLVTFSPIFTNIQPLVERPLFFYIFCRDYGSQEALIKNCLDRAFRDDERYGGKVNRNYTQILDLNSLGNNTRVYRFQRE